MTAPLTLHRADRFLSRLRGLMGKPAMAPNEVLWISRCNSVHTCFMRFPIDVVFLDRQNRIMRVRTGLKPWRMAGCRGAQSVVELMAGQAAERGWRVGQPLHELVGVLP